MRYFVLLTILFTSFNVYSNELITQFKTDNDGELIGWFYTSPATGALDTEVLYEGQPSFRLMRVRNEEESIFVLQRIPLNFDAKQIELRARLKAKDTGPWAGVNVMLRQDLAGSAIQFDNTQPFVSGKDTDWKTVRLTQAINPQADSLVFGAVLVGPGTAWVNGIEILIDGVPLKHIEHTEEATDTGENQLTTLPPADIEWHSLSPEKLDDLALLIQLWGFVKYHHPEVATGQYDWDKYLVVAARDIADGASVDQVFNRWVDDIGLPDNESAAEVDEAQILTQLEFEWFNHALLTEQDSASLHHILQNRYTGKEGFYAFENQMLLPAFNRERQYHVTHLESELRFLGLARLWNVIEYWYPYRDTLTVSWREVLREAVAGVLEAENDRGYRLQLHSLMAKIEDGHAAISPSLFRETPFGECKVPVTVRHIEDRWVVTMVHNPESGLSLGDVILAIDNEAIEQLVEQWTPFDQASNESALNYNLGNTLLTRPCGTPSLELVVERRNERHEVNVPLEPLSLDWLHHGLAGDTIQTLENGIVYARLASLSMDEAFQAIDQAQDSGMLIIDARGYPPEFVLYAIGNTLITEPTEFARLAAARLDAPGVIAMINHVPTIQPEDSQPLTQIAILVDETTLSQPEFSALAWRAIPGAVVVGSTTAGAIGNTVRVPLPNATSASFTGLRVLDTNGEDLQRVGIVPDVYVKPTLDEVTRGVDPVLQRAVALLTASQH